MIQKMKQFILARPTLRNIILPIYFLLRYPYYVVRYGGVDPVEYFVYDKKRMIYLVNPKVAQTTLTRTCACPLESEEEKKAHTCGRRKSITKDEKSYFSYTFIRNPFDRLYSCYCSKYITDKKNFASGILDFDFFMGGMLRKDKGFEHFVKMVCKIPDTFSDRHFKSQYALIHQQSNINLDYIGRYETFSEDYQTLQQKYGLAELPHLNASGKKDWRLAYTPELVDLVAKRYAKDLELWYPNAETALRDFLQDTKK